MAKSGFFLHSSFCIGKEKKETGEPASIIMTLRVGGTGKKSPPKIRKKRMEGRKKRKEGTFLSFHLPRWGPASAGSRSALPGGRWYEGKGEKELNIGRRAPISLLCGEQVLEEKEGGGNFLSSAFAPQGKKKNILSFHRWGSSGHGRGGPLFWHEVFSDRVSGRRVQDSYLYVVRSRSEKEERGREKKGGARIPGGGGGGFSFVLAAVTRDAPDGEKRKKGKRSTSLSLGRCTKRGGCPPSAISRRREAGGGGTAAFFSDRKGTCSSRRRRGGGPS